MLNEYSQKINMILINLENSLIYKMLILVSYILNCGFYFFHHDFISWEIIRSFKRR